MSWLRKINKKKANRITGRGKEAEEKEIGESKEKSIELGSRPT